MTTNRASKASQDRTVLDATNAGEAWSTFECEALVTFADESDEEIARMIGRTLYAVWAKRHAIRTGHAGTSSVRASGTRVVLAYDRGFTTIPQDW